jgi:hypothetical protein
MPIGWRGCLTLVILILGAAPAAEACTRTTPVSLADMTAQADAIVRAKVAGAAQAPHPGSGGEPTAIRFDVLEVVKGDGRLGTLLLTGHLVDRDDFNDAAPPRQVRPSGRSGSCGTDEYRAGAEYLLFLRRTTGTPSWTTRWYPLGPVNEQLTGADDPWVRWVREQVK